MSINVKFNTVTLAVAAALAMIVASPSWAGEQNLQVPPAPMGMGFGPMAFGLLDSARLTKPIRGEETVSPAREQVVLADRDRLPASAAPKGLQPAAVAQEVAPNVASRR